MLTVCRHMAIKKMSMTKSERAIRQPKCMTRSQQCEIMASRFVRYAPMCAEHFVLTANQCARLCETYY